MIRANTRLTCHDRADTFGAAFERTVSERARPHYPSDDRPSAWRRGYNTSWNTARAAYLEKHKTCEYTGCKAKSVCVHHKVPISKGGGHNHGNLMALCHAHHNTVEKSHCKESVTEGARDQQYRQEARDAYTAIYKELETARKRGRLPFRRAYQFGVPGHDVFVRIVAYGRKTGFGRDKTCYPVIQLELPKGLDITEFPDNADTWWWAMKDAFIHEFVHYLDDARSGGNAGGSARDYEDTGDLEAYFNDPGEYNAYWHEVTAWVFDTVDQLARSAGNGPKLRMAFESFYPDFQHFYNTAVNRFAKSTDTTVSTFYRSLTPKNERRLKKRVAQLWNDVNEYVDSTAAGLNESRLSEGADDLKYRKQAHAAFNRVRKLVANMDEDTARELLAFETAMAVPNTDPKVILQFDPSMANADFSGERGTDRVGITLGTEGFIPHKVKSWRKLLLSILDDRESAFIHEYVHYMDRLRRQSPRSRWSAETIATGGMSAYYNSPTEFNAYYQQFAHAMQDAAMDVVKKQGRLPWGSFNEFYERSMLGLKTIDSYVELTPRNKRKVQKRLVQLWDDINKVANAYLRRYGGKFESVHGEYTNGGAIAASAYK